MTLPGMKSTADFATDERPKNWREGIILNSPRNNAPLFGLTTAMGSGSTNDPEFKWWEEDVQLFNYAISADINNSVTTIPIVAGGLKLKVGDMLSSDATGEAFRVATVISDTSITVQTRGTAGAGGTPAGTATAMVAATNPNLLFIGSAYREGAPKAVGTSYNPTQKSNVTQIFRDPIEITRTATATNYRTGDPWKNDRRRMAHKHALGIERAMWLGTRFETLEAGQPLRMTDGIIRYVPSGNIKTVTAGGVDLDELESYLPDIFAYGSREKVAWVSLKTLAIINSIVRKNSRYEWGPAEQEYKMDVRRLYTAAGTLTFMEHPLFGQAGQFLAQDMFVMDTADLRYRYIQDTTLLKDREDRGTDGKTEEYLTECGLEVHNGNHMYWLRGFKAAAIDN